MMTELLKMLHSLSLEHTLCTEAIQVGAVGQSWREQELLHYCNCFTQEKRGTETMHYAQKHVVDYCSSCGVAHVLGGET